MDLKQIIIIAIALTAIILSLLNFLIYRIDKIDKLKKQNKNIEMLSMRNHYEEQLFNLNQKLTSNKEMWEDALHLINNKNYNFNDFSTSYIRESNFLKQHGIEASNIKVNNKSVFLLMPFLKSKRDLFFQIKKILQIYGMECSMGNDEYIKGDILPYVLKKIAESRIIIAYIDGRNPNVFYELGIAHALDKPTILVSHRDKRNEIPIDLNSKYIIFYKDFTDLKDQLSRMINKLLVDQM